MSAWKAKRFWKEATVEDIEGGFTVKLDGRPVKTPAKRTLVMPTRAVAEVVAERPVELDDSRARRHEAAVVLRRAKERDDDRCACPLLQLVAVAAARRVAQVEH